MLRQEKQLKAKDEEIVQLKSEVEALKRSLNGEDGGNLRKNAANAESGGIPSKEAALLPTTKQSRSESHNLGFIGNVIAGPDGIADAGTHRGNDAAIGKKDMDSAQEEAQDEKAEAREPGVKEVGGGPEPGAPKEEAAVTRGDGTAEVEQEAPCSEEALSEVENVEVTGSSPNRPDGRGTRYAALAPLPATPTSEAATKKVEEQVRERWCHAVYACVMQAECHQWKKYIYAPALHAEGAAKVASRTVGEAEENEPFPDKFGKDIGSVARACLPTELTSEANAIEEEKLAREQ